MLNTYLLTSILAAILLLSSRFPYKKQSAILLFAVFLYYSPPTGADYEYYRNGYQSTSVVSDFPYVRTEGLDAEPAFIALMLLGNQVTKDFAEFLALHFVLWVMLIRKAVKLLGISSQGVTDIFICALPAAIPTVTYWSPRSAMSIPLLLFALVYYLKNRPVLTSFYCVAAMLFHSQYIPVASVICAASIIRSTAKAGSLATTSLLSIGILSILRFNISDFMMKLAGVQLVFAFAIYKLHYFDPSEGISSVRPAGIIMILLDTVYLVVIRRWLMRTAVPTSSSSIQNDSGRVLMRMQPAIDLCVAFSLMANAMFITNSHIAGRVSRFADYFLMCIILPLVWTSLGGAQRARVAMLSYALVSMYFYKGIYMFVIEQ